MKVPIKKIHTAQSKELYPEHLRDLRKSGLRDSTVRMMKLRSLSVDELARRLGRRPVGVRSALEFPYPNLPGFSRFKLFPPAKDRKGHVVKYLQGKHSGVHLYIPSPVAQVLKDPSVPLALAEGEKKAAALVQAGVMAIGIGGIWSWVQRGTCNGILEFDEITWIDREVTLYADSDIWHRPNLLNAVYALMKELEERGAKVVVAFIRPGSSEKVGVDDLLADGGERALRSLQMIASNHKVFSKAKRWWRAWKAQGVLSVVAAPSDLRTLIRQIRRTALPEAATFERKQRIATVITDYLLHVGTLYHTEEGRSYFFDGKSRALVALTDEPFLRMLADLTGLNSTETEFKYVVEHLLTETYHRGHKAHVYSLAHYDAASHRVFVTDFGSNMWILDGQTVTRAPNGEGGVLFATSRYASPYLYRPSQKRRSGATLSAFLQSIPLDPGAKVSPAEMRHLLFLWILAAFFPELHPTRLILTIVGPQGATKTSTARRLGVLLLGKQFNVGHLESGERGEQAFIAAVCGKPFAAFDNADTHIRWLADRLATFATGQVFEFRELYSTNKLVGHPAISQLILTSRDPHFRRPDVAERLLLCRVVRPTRFVEDAKLLAETLRDRDDILSDLLDNLNKAVVALRQSPTAPSLPFRMADFAAFAWRLSRGRGDAKGAAVRLTFERLEQEQAEYATEEDSVAVCLGVWCQKPGNLGREINTARLYRELTTIAARDELLLPKTSAALGKHLHLSRRAIESSLGIKIRVISTSHTSRWLITKAVKAL